MEFEKFDKIVTYLKKHDENVTEACNLKIDLIDFCDPLQVIVSELIKEIYGEEGYDWFSWFCYENDYGEKDWSKGGRPIHVKKDDGTWTTEEHMDRYGAHEENGDPICHTIKSTWEYLETNYTNK
jgi:hypothetical protein